MKEILLSEVSSSLEKTITHGDLKDVSIDLVELSLDNLLEDGIAKDIPILKTLIGVGQTVANIRDRLFLKKILAFLSEINKISKEEREEMVYEIDSSNEYKIKVGEKIIYLLDKADDHQVARVIGILFCAFIKAEISYDEFAQSSAIINSIFINDLSDFVDDNNNYLSLKKAENLLNSGLYVIEIEPIDVEVEDSEDVEDRNRYNVDVSGGELSARVSDIGKIIRKVLKSKL